jgi:hypothetical protein
MEDMIHSDLRLLGARQDDIVGTWQLVERGWTPSAIKHRTAGFQRIHDGVFMLGQANPTDHQRRRAATLTAPDTTLSHVSAGASQRIKPWFGSFETVTRPGNGGPRRHGDVLVRRSQIVMAHVTIVDGLRVTCSELTLADLAPALTDRELRKAFREGIRLRRTTARKVHRLATKYPNRRGSTRLTRLAEIYVRLPIDRCRSDAEAMALELLDRAKVAIPEVNRRFAGEEADLCWPSLRLIIEIDGPQWHLFKDEDARKTAIWRAAGFTVVRISSDDVFDRPERFLALAPCPA